MVTLSILAGSPALAAGRGGGIHCNAAYTTLSHIVEKYSNVIGLWVLQVWP